MAKRWYDDACGTAQALERLGERWALLVVRELLFGARRFSDLRAGLPGLSANVLTQRLEGLEAAGVVRRRVIEGRRPVQVYELTAWGLEIEPILRALNRWVAGAVALEAGRPYSAASLMLALRGAFSAELARGFVAVIGFTLPLDRFVARVDIHGIAIRRDDSDRVDLMIEGDPATIAAVVFDGRPLADAVAESRVRYTGSRALAERFVRLFPVAARAADTAVTG
ncbi:hypothetical protein ASE75_00440 [Sphingomonas sp. Leaf17]|uniref:winged helix-turn-helix transcriptional regulator n=1 Tax=Sphingomonas sp. Leaf17 TaxID=1735683 RepID=UPI000701B753|nr:winged helix-turn-helix transcriptional regulator [Sphingomonas sp. Leaf17]KQM67468.1 hypothetical protein ASE75_00440 [Sphingomonas sp. Leaf17]